MSTLTNRLVASIESSQGSITLQRHRPGLGYRLAENVEGLGAGNVENTVTPRLKRRGAMLSDQRETEGDMFLPIIVAARTPTELRSMVDELRRVMKPADGTFRFIVTNQETGHGRYRDVAYESGLDTPEWSSPTSRLYRINVDYLDPWAYATEPQSTRIDSSPDQGATGWLAPFVFPLASGSLGEPVDGAITNSGDCEAPLTVTFAGQVTEPRIRNRQTGAVIGIRGELAWDERITIDAHAETVELWRTGTPEIRQSVPGRLTRSTRLTAMTAAPGQNVYEFRSESAVNAFVEISAPSAYSSL